MRKPGLVLATVAVALLATSSSGVGAEQRGRTEISPYQGPSEVEGGTFNFTFGPIAIAGEQVAGGVRFETRRSESRVHVSVTDESGTRVKVHIEQIWKQGQHRELIGHVCGSTHRPLKINPGKPLYVYPSTGACRNGGAIPTQGEIEVTFLP